MGKLFSGKMRWLVNVFVILLLGFMLFLMTVYNDSLKQLTANQFNRLSGKVLGDMITLPEAKAGNPKEKQKELLTKIFVVTSQSAKQAVNPLIEQALQIRIGDIINSYSQIKRLSQDTQNVRKIVMEKLRRFAE